jgi:hypothetical protein
MERVEDARAQADEVVVKSLYTKATIDKDTTAMIFWLKNRQPHLWRDRKELEVAIGDVQGMLRTAAERARERKRVMLEAIRRDAITTKVVGGESSALVPFVPGGNGGNGHE